MKTEMTMLPNGNYESIISPIQHRCFKNSCWSCVEYGSQLGKLLLNYEIGDPYEDGNEAQIEVNYCPFCGYKPKYYTKRD